MAPETPAPSERTCTFRCIVRLRLTASAVTKVAFPIPHKRDRRGRVRRGDRNDKLALVELTVTDGPSVVEQLPVVARVVGLEGGMVALACFVASRSSERADKSRRERGRGKPYGDLT